MGTGGDILVQISLYFCAHFLIYSKPIEKKHCPQQPQNINDEMKNIQRRDFIIGTLTTIGSIAFPAAGCDAAAADLDGEIKNEADANTIAYSVAVLGDTHYDTAPESVYHAHYDESNPHSRIQRSEFRRNGEMWRERCPRLLASSAALAHRNKTDFILQLGDMIQGDCDHIPTHQKMLDDCIKMLKKPYPDNMPFLTVVGNHDFRGKGARKAYFDFAHPFMAKEIEKQASKVGCVMDVLIEINSGSEISKSGVEPSEAREFAHRLVGGDYPHIRLRGFMTMAPKSTEAEYRAIFRGVRELCRAIWAELPMAEEKMELSMGMSESYVPAAAEGATMVRVGRGLFVKDGE